MVSELKLPNQTKGHPFGNKSQLNEYRAHEIWPSYERHETSDRQPLGRVGRFSSETMKTGVHEQLKGIRLLTIPN